MKKTTSILLIFAFILIQFASPNHAYAESFEEYLETMGDRIYEDAEILYDADVAFMEGDFNTGFAILKENRDNFIISNDIYTNGLNFRDNEDYASMSFIIESAINGSQKAIEGIDNLVKLEANAQSYSTEVFESELTTTVRTLEDSYVLYGELLTEIDSLVQNYFLFVVIYAAGFVIGLIGLIATHLLKKRQDESTAEGRGKTFIYKRMRHGMLWFAGGFLVTLISYLFLPGSTYYVLWGPPLYGLFEVIRGLFEFVKVKGNWDLHYPSDHLNHDKVDHTQFPNIPQQPAP